MIRYIILDVDGTLTDSGIYYDNCGNELKRFSTRDGLGIVAARTAGITVLVLTGRECEATTRRLTELGVTGIYQNVKDKTQWVKDWLAAEGIDRAEVVYIGDDLNDLGAMRLCGTSGCPADAVEEVRKEADYVSPLKGGYGAARDVIEHYMKSEGLWNDAINEKAF